MPDYSVYGLAIRSDRPITGLTATELAVAPDLSITLGSGAPPGATWQDAPIHYEWAWAPDVPPSVVVRRDARGFWFRYLDGTEFTLDADATRVEAWWADASTIEDTSAYLLGPILGFALRLRGVLALHASAVVIDGVAVALIGTSGAGKSTTAAAFAARGWSVLADDVLALREVDGRVLAYPSYGLLRLWTTSEKILFGTEGSLPRLTPTWEKRALTLGDDRPFQDAPVPLGPLMLLAPRVDDASAPFAQPMATTDACLELVVHSYANYLLDAPMRGRELAAIARVLEGRRVARVTPHADPERLPALVELIADLVRRT